MPFYSGIVERSRQKFLNHVSNNTSIAEYFEIKPKNGSLEFTVTNFVNGRYKFTVKYKRNYLAKHDFVNLPTELNDIINSYLDDFIIIELIVDLRHNYPFSKTILNVIKVEDSYSTRLPIKLYDYYNKIAKNHNKMNNQNNWSPALDLKLDMLLFISRIHHFEVFDDY